MCRLKPDEFWSLTPWELRHLIFAIVEEEKRQDDVQNQRTSWQTAHLMNASGNYKRKIKATDLYKPIDHVEEPNDTSHIPKQNIVKRFESAEAKEEYMNNLLAKFGK